LTHEDYLSGQQENTWQFTARMNPFHILLLDDPKKRRIFRAPPQQGCGEGKYNELPFEAIRVHGHN
jgi:hypothetical protein